MSDSLATLLREARNIIRASSQRNLVKDWDRRATEALAAGTTEVQRLEHNVRVLTDALWKACADDRDAVNSYIESEGGLL